MNFLFNKLFILGLTVETNCRRDVWLLLNIFQEVLLELVVDGVQVLLVGPHWGVLVPLVSIVGLVLLHNIHGGVQVDKQIGPEHFIDGVCHDFEINVSS